jgi:uncharacterized repeat protein (TIGR01451 family)
VPCVAIRVRVPAETAAGRELTYQLVAENLSRAAAHHVTVSVPLRDPKVPANATFVRATPEPDEDEPVLVWKLGTLRGLEKRQISLVVKPTGDGDVSCCARVKFEHGQCVRTRINRPGLQLRKTGPTEAPRYDMLTFKIEVRNSGRTTLRNVVLEETLPEGLIFSNSKPPTSGGSNTLVWKLDTLAPGAARVVEYTAVPEKVGTLTTVAVARTDGFRQKAEHRIKVGQPRLAVVKTGPKKALVGWPVTYRLTVRNTGTWAATRISLVDELPKGIEFVSATAGGKFERDTVLPDDVKADAARWELGTLKPGESRTVQLVVRSRKPASFKNVCTASADRDIRGVQASVETEFKEAAGLALLLEKGSDPALVGESLSLTVRVLNAGKGKEENVTVVLTVPKGLTLQEVQGVEKPEIKDGKVTLPTLRTLLPRGEQAYVVRFKADSAGSHTIQGEATSPARPDAPARDEEKLTVKEPRPKKAPEPGD